MNNVTVPKTTVVELRQQNNNSQVVANGDYQVNVGEEIILEEGDTLQIKSVYLDTGATESGYIELPKDDPQPDGADPQLPVCTINIGVGKYVMNVPSSQETTFYTTDTASKAVVQSKIVMPRLADGNANAQRIENTNIAAFTDGKPYVMCSATENTAGTTSFLIDNYTVELADPTKNGAKVPSALLLAPQSWDISYFPPNTPDPIPAGTQRKKYTISFNPDDLSTSDKTALVNSFDSGGFLVVNQDLIDRFPTAFSGAFNVSSGFPFDADGGNNTPLITRTTPAPKGYTITTFGPNTSANAVGAKHFSPIEELLSFTLPAQKYTASELATRITREVSKINQVGDIGHLAFQSTNSCLYRSIKDQLLQENPNFVPGADDNTAYATLNGKGPIVFVEANVPITATARKSFRFNSLKTGDLNYMIGSSGGFALAYDEVSQKFSINNMHSPLRDINPVSTAEGSAQVRGYIQPTYSAPGTAGNPEKHYVNKYSGIFFTRLEPQSVWFNQMKFNPKTIIATNAKSKGGTHKIGFEPFAGHIDNREEYLIDQDGIFLEDGVNTTGAYEGVGTAEQHGITTTDAGGGGADANNKRIAADTSTFDTEIQFVGTNDPTEVLQPPPFISSNTDQVFTIFGNSQVNTGQETSVQDEGYYKVVVDSKISNELIGADSRIRNVSAIVSKYNSYGSFTSAYNEGSVSYTHKGTPLTLSDFRVKILTPDGELATDIMDRNSVFLEIIKNQ